MKDAQWMVKDYSISYYPSLYSFNYFNAKKFESMDGSFIGFGNPTFNKEEKNYR